MTDARFMCAVCRRPLDRHVEFVGNDQITTWLHAVVIDGTPDHTPVPVPAVDGEMVTLCDFCGTPGVLWVYPCADFPFVIAELADGDELGQGSSGDWGACQACHEDIERDDWPAVLDRRSKEPMERLLVAVMLDGFQAHRTGPAHPLHEGAR